MATHKISMRTLASAAALCLVAAGTAACDVGGGGSGSDADFTYWSMWKVGEPQQKVIARAIEDFEKETGKTVDVQWQGRENLTKLVPALNTNSVPDLVDGPYVKAVPALVVTNQARGLADAYDLDVEGSTLGDLIPAKYLENIDIYDDNDEPWMVPYQITSDAVWFNAAEHPDIASNPPATWDEWVTDMEKIKGDGEAPLATDGDIAGYNAAYFVTALLREAGSGALKEVASDETGQAWLEPDVLAAAEKVEELVDKGFFIDGYNASKFPAQQQKWADNQAAFMYNGSWVPTESSTYVANGFKFGSFPWPAAEEGGDMSMRVDFSGFMIPAKSDGASAAEEFMAFFLRKKYQDAWGTDAGVIPVREDAEISPDMAGVQESIASATSFHQQNDGVAFAGYNEKVFWPHTDELILGKVSAQEFVEAMAKAQADYWESQS